MSIFTGIAIYILLWWVCLFGVLPLGVKGQVEDGEIVQGSEPGAPVKADMKRKAILTSVVAAVFWVIIFVIIQFELIDIPGRPK